MKIEKGKLYRGKSGVIVKASEDSDDWFFKGSVVELQGRADIFYSIGEYLPSWGNTQFEPYDVEVTVNGIKVDNECKHKNVKEVDSGFGKFYRDCEDCGKKLN